MRSWPDHMSKFVKIVIPIFSVVLLALDMVKCEGPESEACAAHCPCSACRYHSTPADLDDADLDAELAALGEEDWDSIGADTSGTLLVHTLSPCACVWVNLWVNLCCVAPLVHNYDLAEESYHIGWPFFASCLINLSPPPRRICACPYSATLRADLRAYWGTSSRRRCPAPVLAFGPPSPVLWSPVRCAAG